MKNEVIVNYELVENFAKSRILKKIKLLYGQLSDNKLAGNSLLMQKWYCRHGGEYVNYGMYISGYKNALDHIKMELCNLINEFGKVIFSESIENFTKSRVLKKIKLLYNRLSDDNNKLSDNSYSLLSQEFIKDKINKEGIMDQHLLHNSYRDGYGNALTDIRMRLSELIEDLKKDLEVSIAFVTYIKEK